VSNKLFINFQYFKMNNHKKTLLPTPHSPLPPLSYYPVILIPERIEKFLLKNPVGQFPNFQKPIAPEPPKDLPKVPEGKWGYVNSTLSLGLILIVNGLFGLSLVELCLGILASSFLFFGVKIYLYYARLYYQEKQQQIFANYEAEKTKYLRAFQLWERSKNAIIKTQKNQQQLRGNELKLLLENRVKQPIKKSQAQVGVSERIFAVSLVKYFGKWVQGGQEFPITNSHLCYSTDFSLVDPNTGLSLDIEVDEPYDGKSKKPHHCVDVNKDYNRNQYFLNGNWVVIRFAEEQVVKYPKRCCLEIAQVIAKLTGNYEFLEVLKDVEVLPKVKQWTFAEAQQMAKRRFRQRFLAEEGVYFATEKKRKNNLNSQDCVMRVFRFLS
jgi:hypothetical protein